MSFPQRALGFVRKREEEMRSAASTLYNDYQRRRSVRDFSTDPIPLDVVRTCIRTACAAPSGANKQPWTFVLVTDKATKSKIRAAAEKEERAFYRSRASKAWLADLAHLGTDDKKPFLDDAPALIVVFAQSRGAQGQKHYYVKESVGLAVGALLVALHNAGLATLTHTPSPMKFLGQLLGRPENETAYLLLPVGYPADGCMVPDIGRKAASDVLVEI